MNDACRMPALLLAAWMATMPAALAQDSERNRYFVQQMIEMAAADNEQGVVSMQRMLEQNPRPAASDPAAARAAFQRGLTLFGQDALDTALEAFQQASRDDPGNTDAANYAGLVYRKMGRFPEAEAALQQALTLEPTRAVAWFQLAQVYGLKNDAHRALGALANTYRFAQNQMRAEEILRNIAENEAADSLRNAALEALRLFHLPAETVIVPPLPANPGGIVPMNSTPSPGRAP
ncbi:MAG: tetratricopeptide repeat protein [Candidatus Competibacteraceae bacterium]|nr:MAG: tetratricopeptide repeat protein [Candidatus Competibacteraceae bacterium]